MDRPQFDYAHRGVTMINVFTVKPENQQALLEALRHEADTLMRTLPGYVHSVVHQSRDGQRVLNYTMWESAEAFDASHRHPEYLRLRQVNGHLLESADQHLYDVAFALDASGPVT